MFKVFNAFNTLKGLNIRTGGKSWCFTPLSRLCHLYQFVQFWETVVPVIKSLQGCKTPFGADQNARKLFIKALAKDFVCLHISVPFNITELTLIYLK